MSCLWKLLLQRNRGISLEGHWRVLTHILYKFWGIYTITKLRMEINLSHHTSLMELVILLKVLWTPQLLLLIPWIFKEIDGSPWKAGVPQTLPTSWRCAAPCRSFLQVWGTYPNCWEVFCLPILSYKFSSELPQLEITFLKDMFSALAFCIHWLLDTGYILLAPLLKVRDTLKSHLSFGTPCRVHWCLVSSPHEYWSQEH